MTPSKKASTVLIERPYFVRLVAAGRLCLFFKKTCTTQALIRRK
jgi:hypothetical protein